MSRRRVAVWCGVGALVALVPGCTAQVGADPDSATVAILRAVPSADGEAALRDELRTAGYVEGRNLEVLGADGEEAYPDAAEAEEVVRQWLDRSPDLIVAMSTSSAMAAQAAAPDVDVLFLSNDPQATGLVRNEQRPEGRLTGMTYRVPSDRTLTLLQRLIPRVSTVGLPVPAQDAAGAAHRDAVAAAASTLGITLLVEEFTAAEDVSESVDRLVRRGAQTIMLSSSPLAIRALEETEAAVARHDLPAIANSNVADFAVLALYPDSEELQRQLGRQAARLLTGSSPSAVPVENPRRFHIRVNGRVAEELGIDVPVEVQREADEVVLR